MLLNHVRKSTERNLFRVLKDKQEDTGFLQCRFLVGDIVGSLSCAREGPAVAGARVQLIRREDFN